MSSNMIFLVATAFIALILLLFSIVRALKTREPISQSEIEQKAPQAKPEPVQHVHRWKRVPFEQYPAFTDKQPLIENQSPAWIAGMAATGSKFSRLNISRICFVHGTFVGDDPFDIFRLTEALHPRLAKVLRLKIKIEHDSLLNDNGWFTTEYVELAQTFLGPAIHCDMYSWSSGNHHLARLKGALGLTLRLGEQAEAAPSGSGILLTGHSHAGQLFALLSRLISQNEFARQMLAITKDAGYTFNPSLTLHYLKQLSGQKLYFATLGTPPRYQWHLTPNMKLIHLINHRLEDPIAGSASGILTTRDGDYIQQWGIAGSDSLSPLKKHHLINKALNRYLDPGCSPIYWKSELKKKRRLHDSGFNFLVDYGDHSKTPNCLATIFGHGIYTRCYTQLFNLNLMADYFSERGP